MLLILGVEFREIYREREISPQGLKYRTQVGRWQKLNKTTRNFNLTNTSCMDQFTLKPVNKILTVKSLNTGRGFCTIIRCSFSHKLIHQGKWFPKKHLTDKFMFLYLSGASQSEVLSNHRPVFCGDLHYTLPSAKCYTCQPPSLLDFLRHQEEVSPENLPRAAGSRALRPLSSPW